MKKGKKQMNEATHLKYSKAYQRAVDFMVKFYAENKTESNIREAIVKEYKKNKMDPDGKAVRFKSDIKCTADALLSILRICSLEGNIDDVIPTYEEYRKTPVFFFPCENGGINTSRNSKFGDRIDHTLYDLKMYFSDKEKCLMKDAYARTKTKAWLKSMGSFENIIDWFGVKGIFTDEKYNVLDLEFETDKIITSYKSTAEYHKQWTDVYYNNIKKKTQEIYRKYSELEQLN